MAKQKEAFAEQQRKLKEERNTLDVQLTEQRKKERELAERERALENRETNAEAGFAEMNRNVLARLVEERKVLRDEMSAHRSRMASEIVAFEEDFARLRKSREVEEERQEQAVADDVRHRQAVFEGIAEVAAKEAADPLQVLDRQRLVEAVELAQEGDLLLEVRLALRP